MFFTQVHGSDSLASNEQTAAWTIDETHKFNESFYNTIQGAFVDLNCLNIVNLSTMVGENFEITDLKCLKLSCLEKNLVPKYNHFEGCLRAPPTSRGHFEGYSFISRDFSRAKCIRGLFEGFEGFSRAVATLSK